MIDLADRFKGALFGLATGDALGTTVEFSTRGSFTPLTDMVGGGPFELEPGEWTDDTSMALCLAKSLLSKNGFDADDLMIRFCRWRDSGYMSSTGTCFDIGNTVNAALQRYKQDGNPFAGDTHPGSAGNGSIMRLAPVAMYFYPELPKVRLYAAESSSTTHGALECVESCQLMAHILYDIFSGAEKEDLLDRPEFKFEAAKVQEIAAGKMRSKDMSEVRGSGYVIECLEAALWCFYETTTFDDCVLLAANLGDDADTTSAVAGQFAGAYYGYHSINTHWIQKLTLSNQIEELALELLNCNMPENTV